MKVKMNDIIEFLPFYEAVKDQKLSMKIAYQLAKLANVIDNEMAFYREKLQMIIKEYGELDEKGEPITIENGGIKLREGTQIECMTKMGDLQNLDVELPDITLTINDFDGIELTVEAMRGIMPFITD